MPLVPAEISMDKPAAKEREAEPDSEVTLLNEVRDLFRWHPWKNHLRKFAHQHPLKFYHEKKTYMEVNCSTCGLSIEKNATYGCSECKDFFLHKACAEFPLSVKHPFHKDPLKLVQDTTRNPPVILGHDKSKKKCSGCELPLRDTTTYACENCNVYLHKFCMELPEKIKHTRHAAHFLPLNYEALVGRINDFWCSVCTKIHKGLNYSCESCDFNLCLQCITKEAHKPDGTQGHIITFLEQQPEDQLEDHCLACGEIFDDSEPVFRCNDCFFSLHFNCVMDPNIKYLPPTAKADRHEHDLTFYKSRKEYNGYASCDFCDGRIADNWPLYHCSDCEYDAHLHCALPDRAAELQAEQPPKMSELPSSVKISSHVHHLELADSSKNVYGSYFYFYCDVCGNFGESELPFYICEGCEFIVHATCMLHECKMSFAHKLDYVVLDTSPILIANPSLRVCEIIESLKDDEKNKLSNVIKAATRETLGGANNEPRSREQGQGNTVNDIQVISSSNSDDDEPFSKIISRLESKCTALDYFEAFSQVEIVKDVHIISKNLAPVLDKLLSKYKDFSKESPLTKEGKAYIFMLLCAALYSLCITREEKLSEIQLFTCWDCFKIAKHAGFKVNFAFERLSKAMYAYFDIRATTSASQAPSQLDSEMMKLKEKMEALRVAPAKRMTSLLSDTVPRSKTMEIVGEKSHSWDEYWKAINENIVTEEEPDPNANIDTETEQDEHNTTTESANSADPDSDQDPGLDLDGEKEQNTSEKDEDSNSNVIPDPVSDKEDQHEKSEAKNESSESERETESESLATTIMSKLIDLADSALNLVEKIEYFVAEVPSKRSLSYFANKHYSFKENIEDRVLCSKCQALIEDPTQGCIKCNYTDEQQPPKILSDFHNHALHFYKEGNKEGNKENSTSTKSHKKVKEDRLCFACGFAVADPAYRCAKCNIFLHVFCIQFPAEIPHPLHPAHDLSLEANSETLKKITCNACGEKCRNCGFVCNKCNFCLEIQCLFSIPTVQSESHGKLLLFPEKKPSNGLDGCFTCGGKITDPPFLRCAPCNLSLHVQCTDLPSTRKCACGKHPLTLIPLSHSQTEAHAFGDSHCYVCDKERHPLLPIYYCQECKRAAHIECVTYDAAN